MLHFCSEIIKTETRSRLHYYYVCVSSSRAVPCHSALHPDCDNNFIFFLLPSSQNRDIAENWQWQEGSGAPTHSTPVLNSSSVPRVVSIRGGWPGWLTFKVNCLIPSTYYIITAGSSQRVKHVRFCRKSGFTKLSPRSLQPLISSMCCSLRGRSFSFFKIKKSNFLEQLWSCFMMLTLRLKCYCGPSDTETNESFTPTAASLPTDGSPGPSALHTESFRK